MILKSERIIKCQLSPMMKENVPEPPSKILEVLKVMASGCRRMLERNSGTRISKLGELKCLKERNCTLFWYKLHYLFISYYLEYLLFEVKMWQCFIKGFLQCLNDVNHDVSMIRLFIAKSKIIFNTLFIRILLKTGINRLWKSSFTSTSILGT